jgi:hypothetical protein
LNPWIKKQHWHWQRRSRGYNLPDRSNMAYMPYLWLLLISALLNGSLALYTQQYHAVPSVKPFQILMWLVTAWALRYGLGRM